MLVSRNPWLSAAASAAKWGRLHGWEQCSLSHGSQPVRTTVRCQGYGYVKGGKCAHYTQTPFLTSRVWSAARTLSRCPCPSSVWTGPSLQMPFNHFLFITPTHSLTENINTLTRSRTYTDSQPSIHPMLSRQINSWSQKLFCPSGRPFPAGPGVLKKKKKKKRESNLFPILPENQRVLIVSPSQSQERWIQLCHTAAKVTKLCNLSPSHSV